MTGSRRVRPHPRCRARLAVRLPVCRPAPSASVWNWPCAKRSGRGTPLRARPCAPPSRRSTTRPLFRRAQLPAASSGGPHSAGAVAGLGAGDTERRSLTQARIEDIVRAEVAERQAAARDYDRAGRADQADRLRREAGVLLSVMNAGGPSRADTSE